MAKRLVVGNWKMNPSSLEEARKIAQKTRRTAADLRHTDVAVCPPFVFIQACLPRTKASHYSVGAQNISYESGGAFTGEVGAPMLRDIGAEYVIIGHSEERAKGDTDDIISKKAKAAVEAGLIAILCVGERERDEGGRYLDMLKEQMKGSLNGIEERYAEDIIIAYEPLWAIGAKEAMMPAQIYEMSIFVRKVFADIFGQEAAMKAKVLYGGAVNFRNAADMISIGKVDGLLVGRESVNIAGFIDLLRAVDAVPERT